MKNRNFACFETVYTTGMRRLCLTLAAILTLGAVPVLFAQRGGDIQFHGTPASVTSPGPNGMPRGVAASVTDPTFGNNFQFRGSVNFGHRRGFDGRGRHHPVPVYAVPYYGYYGIPFYDYSSYEEQPQQQVVQPQVIVTKEESSRSDDDSRYGEHYFDGRENKRDSAPMQMAQSIPPPQPAQELPPTTLVYRDGHKSEVRNYAIVGSNLIDLTKGPVLKKIPLDSLDLEATRKQNEENGVDFHTP